MVNKQYPLLENPFEEGKWGMVDDLNVKLVGSKINIFFLENTG